MKITKGVKSKPRNILLYGEHGTGKTTLASSFPSCVIVDIEGGSDDIDVARTDRIKDFTEFQTIMSDLCSEHDFKTVAIDSIDWLEKLVQQDVARKDGKESIEAFGYGKGYTLSAEAFERVVINHLRALNSRGLAVVLICHAKAVKHNPPDGVSYERWEPDLHDKVQGPLVEFCDEVFFLKKKTFTKKEDLGFNKDRNIVIGTEERVLITYDTGSVVAKNRLSMPCEIPANFNSYAQYIMAKRNTAAPQEGNINGIVRDGSSKTPSNEAAKELAETNLF